MNEHKITVVFSIKAENKEQAKQIIEHEIQKNIPFKCVPYAQNDSGIVNFGVMNEHK